MTRVLIFTTDYGEQFVWSDTPGVTLIRGSDSKLFGVATEVPAIAITESAFEDQLRRLHRETPLDAIAMPDEVSPVPTLARSLRVIDGGK